MGTWIKGVPPKMLHDKFGIYKGFWMPEMDRCWIRKEDHVCVCSRLIRTEWGNVEHVTITKGIQTEILNNLDLSKIKDGSGGFTWAEKQEIKDELFGKNRVAIEVYPKENRLVDSADVYHLWVFDKKFDLPFGIHPKETIHAVNRGYNVTNEDLENLKDFYDI